jgi:hypothetical protein
MIMKPTNGYFTAALLGTLLLAGCAGGDVADNSPHHRLRAAHGSQSSGSEFSEFDQDTAQSLQREEVERNDTAAANDEYHAQLEQISQDAGS